VNPRRRGACPGVADPMPTGDGLLARLMPPAPMSLDAFLALCDASQTHGNGIMEVTQRGSLQVRGLSPDSAVLFARAAAALGLGSETHPVILASPLFGLDTRQNVDLPALSAALRAELARHPEPRTIGPKVSLLIDGGGALHLDEVPADLRMRIVSASRFHLSMAGNAAAAMNLGWVEPSRAVQAIALVLIAIADRGKAGRARDFADDAGDALRASLAGLLTPGAPPPPRPRAEPIGTHCLNDGWVARGIAPAFGYCEAGSLKRLAHASVACGAASIRPAPGRALLFIGLTPVAAEEFAAVAAADGWVVRPDDVRRHVIACAGAPACATATLSTRRLAPAIAQAAKALLDGSITIHVSGCAKGCAHPGAAALTLIGPDGLVLQGRASDAPQGRVSPANLLAGLERLQATVEQSRTQHSAQMPCAEILSRLGARRLIESLGGEPAHG
jgi:precorrin-3B synthase